MKNYYQANRERFLSELFELLRIPSISSDPAHKDDMYACARKLTSLLKEAGADRAEVYETCGSPHPSSLRSVTEPSTPEVPTMTRASHSCTSRPSSTSYGTASRDTT